MAHLLGQKNKATASGGGTFTCCAARYILRAPLQWQNTNSRSTFVNYNIRLMEERAMLRQLSDQ